jgi:hypothetical protein
MAIKMAAVFGCHTHTHRYLWLHAYLYLNYWVKVFMHLNSDRCGRLYFLKMTPPIYLSPHMLFLQGDIDTSSTQKGVYTSPMWTCEEVSADPVSLVETMLCGFWGEVVK